MKRILFFAVSIAAVMLAGGASAGEKLKLDSGKVVVANPSLVSQPGEKFSLPEDASVQEQLALLAKEINRLRAAASRAVLIFQADMELNKKLDSPKNVDMTLSGGRLPGPLTCKSDFFGTCVFIVEPLEPGDADYRITMSAKKYVDAEREFRVEPGAVALITVRIEMSVQEREKRINPPPLMEE